MRNCLLMMLFCGLVCLAKGQSASVEQSTFGVQAGLLGVWAHKEMKLSNRMALRAEIGMDAGFWGGDFYPKNGYIFTPVIRLEPRWYYNLKKRAAKSKPISGNSGNYLTLQSTFNPNWFVISNYDNVTVVEQVTFIPTWGIRRSIGSHFTYETGIGIGYRYYFSKSVGYARNYDEATLNLHVRVGYRF